MSYLTIQDIENAKSVDELSSAAGREDYRTYPVLSIDGNVISVGGVHSSAFSAEDIIKLAGNNLNTGNYTVESVSDDGTKTEIQIIEDLKTQSENIGDVVFQAEYYDLDSIDQAIEGAESAGDSYFATRYNTPLAEVPAALKIHLVNVCFYFLLGSNFSRPDQVTEDYKAAIKYFEAIAKGTVMLPDANTEDEDAPESQEVYYDAYDSVADKTGASF